MKIGILGTSDIAFRRFLPALKKLNLFKFAGVASRDITKTKKFTDIYGGKGYDNYTSLLNDEEIGYVYIPLPPSMHFEWAQKAINCGKHIILEKPFTTSFKDTSTLIELAHSKDIALHENYMFLYHNQINWILSKLPELGNLRLIRLDFGFPFKGVNDFRYNNEMGGGALLDCGGYTLKLATLLLGETARILSAALGYKDAFEVDIFGSATLINNNGLTAQISFGMDNNYRCSFDAWGSIGTMTTDRVFTAPVDYEPDIIIKNAEGVNKYKLEPDDSFANSILHFYKCINNKNIRTENYTSILKQAEIVKQFNDIAG